MGLWYFVSVFLGIHYSNLAIPFHQTKMSIYISHDDKGDAWQTMVSSHFMQREKAVCIGRVNSTHFLKEKQKKSTFPKADASEMKSILQIHTSDVSQNELQAAKSTLKRQKCKCKCGRMRVKWNLRR